MAPRVNDVNTKQRRVRVTASTQSGPLRLGSRPLISWDRLPRQLSVNRLSHLSSVYRGAASPSTTARWLPLWRNSRLHPKSAFSRFSFVHRADLEGQQWVDLTRSPNPSGDDRYLRSPDGWSRRIADVADRGHGRPS
jgi:hypothetical protein